MSAYRRRAERHGNDSLDSWDGTPLRKRRIYRGRRPLPGQLPLFDPDTHEVLPEGVTRAPRGYRWEPDRDG